MLEFLDGDSGQVLDSSIKVPVFLEVQGTGGGFAFEMRMIDEHVRQIRQHFGQPIRRHFLAKQKHLTEIPTSNFQHPEKNTKARKLLKRLISNGGCAGWMRVARSKINCPNFAVPGHNNTTYNPMKNDDMALNGEIR